MPAHIAHQLFADEAIARAFPERKPLSSELRPIVAFAAQGPDFFFHNRKTSPFSTIYGKLLHDEGYGRLVSYMAALVAASGASAFSVPGVYVLAFMTHAILDRVVHPYIIYHSGWVDPDKPESAKYYQCHAYFERVIDVLVLAERRGIGIGDYDFLSQVDLGREPPAEIERLIVRAVALSHPGLSPDLLSSESLRSAYSDSMWYWAMTNPTESATLRKRLAPEFLEPSRRFLALVHPARPEDTLDVLNRERRNWAHPWDAEAVSSASFMDLYEEALSKAAAALPAIASFVASGPGKPDPRTRLELEEVLGNAGLDSGKTGLSGELPRFSDPFPLAERIEQLYR